jgi:hypothetical protein
LRQQDWIDGPAFLSQITVDQNEVTVKTLIAPSSRPIEARAIKHGSDKRKFCFGTLCYESKSTADVLWKWKRQPWASLESDQEPAGASPLKSTTIPADFTYETKQSRAHARTCLPISKRPRGMQ